MILIDPMNIQYTAVRNPRWMNPEHTVLDCEVNFDHIPEEWVGFGAVAEGDYPHTHRIFAECVAGTYGPIAPYEAPEEE